MFIRWSHKMISHIMLSRSALKESSARVFRWEIFWKERQCLWNILDMVSRSEWYSCFTFLFKNGRCKSSLSASSWNNARVEQDDRRWRGKVMHREFLPNLREKILWETSNNRMIHGGEDKRNGSQNWYWEDFENVKSTWSKWCKDSVETPKKRHWEVRLKRLVSMKEADAFAMTRWGNCSDGRVNQTQNLEISVVRALWRSNVC